MRLLTLCFPTYGQLNPLHLNSRGDRIVLAPDEFHRQLLELGWEIDVVSIAEPTQLPLFCSGLPLKAIGDVNVASYDVFWHMFRDPTQPEVLQRLAKFKLNYHGRTVINRAEGLARHNKREYLPVFYRHGLAPKIFTNVPKSTIWTEHKSEALSRDNTLISTYAFNNNRGDYVERRGNEKIITEFIDNAKNGMRSIVRFGYAFGMGFEGFEYFNPADIPTFKSGSAMSFAPYTVPMSLRAAITKVMSEIKCDVAHIEAVPTGDRLAIIDVNPYPTAAGKTLSIITADLSRVLTNRFAPKSENSAAPDRNIAK